MKKQYFLSLTGALCSIGMVAAQEAAVKPTGGEKPKAEAASAEKPSDHAEKPKTTEEILAALRIDPAATVTRHSIRIQGKTLRYTATAGTMPLLKPTGEAKANVFYVAYTLDEPEPSSTFIVEPPTATESAPAPAEPAPTPPEDGAPPAPSPETASPASPEPPPQNSQPPSAPPAAPAPSEKGKHLRPVTFCFNGGPGSSAVWLHLGAFGPKRVVLPDAGITPPKPPYQLTDNEYSLLEVTDLVFLDPVSTGWSRAEKGEDAKQFHGYTEDIQSVGDFIRLYVTRNKRWKSPKFLMGESYGAIRGSGLAEHLQERHGMFLNGLIIVSGVLDFQTISAAPSNVLPYVLFFPTLTAVAHYHKKLDAELQKDFAATLQASRAFAHGAYATALHQGNALPAEEKDRLAGEIARFTGLPKDHVLRQNLRVSASDAFRKLLEAENLTVGRFDGRCTGPSGSGDPSYSLVYGAFSSALNEYLRTDLGVANDQPYEILTGQVQPWNYQPFTNRYLTVGDALAGAIKDNPALKVYIACGHYDLATPPDGIRYSVNHLDLPENLRGNIRFGDYEGGHMMYTNLPELQRLTAELSQFIREAK